MPRKTQEIFIFIPKKYNLSRYKILIDGVDKRNEVISAEFSKAIAPDMGTFKLTLINNNNQFKNLGSVDVELQHDFSDGTTTRFKGKIEEIKDDFGEEGHGLEVMGSHVAGELLDRSVIASYDGSLSADGVIKDLIDNFAPSGFTYVNVKASSVFPIISFNAVPLWKALSDVAELAKNFDLYVDDDKDLHFFKQGSINNDDEAVVIGQSLIELERLGKDVLDVRNKIRVYGEADGLPVIYTAEDKPSQDVFGVKESTIQDTNITTEAEAESIGEARLAVEKNNYDIGGGTALILSSLQPGDFSFINNGKEILGRFRFVRFKHMFPTDMTEFEVEDVRT